MMKIAFFEVEPWEKDYINTQMRLLQRKFVNPVETVFSTEKLAVDNAKNYADCDIISVFIFSMLNKKVLDKLKKVKHINTMSTGYDHIDLEECKKRNITVSNVPSYGENTVAEHAFALILAISRQIVPSIERTRRGKFETGADLRGFDLKDKTIGVIGTGRIGSHAIKMAKGFGMNVVAFDAFPNASLANELGFKYVTLDELLSQSKVITLHAPLLPTTKHMINIKNITKIKPGTVIINTARGGLIETDALMWALENKMLLGLGVDVLEEENNIKDEKIFLSKDFDSAQMKTLLEEHMLAEYDNVLITPHNAFNSEEALKRILDTSVQNVSGALTNQKINLVK